MCIRDSPYTYRASDGLTFVMVASGWKEENLTGAITYGLSHDVLNNGYSFQYAVVPEAYWETRESGTYFGQKQCEFQELKDPDNTVSIRLQISNYSDVSDSLIEEAIRQMKDRMDIIGTPYAFGMDIQSEDALSAIVREYSAEAELSENALDLVAAAVKEPTDQQPEQDRKKRP